MMENATEAFWHLGILVHDLPAAIERYTRTMGIEFHPPITVPMGGLQQAGTEEDLTLSLAFSKVGPPYLELIRAAGTGLFRPDQGEGLHHFGVWMADGEQLESRLRKDGIDIAARNILPDGQVLTIFTEPRELNGIAIEYVAEFSREAVEHFLRTGSFPDHLGSERES